jgi:hypothetical protein
MKTGIPASRRFTEVCSDEPPRDDFIFRGLFDMFRFFYLGLFSVCLGGLFLSPAQAAKVKVWQHHNAAHHEKSQFKQTVLSSEGAVRLAREVKLLANLEVTHIWDVVESKNGDLIVATGDEGKLFRVTAEGKVSLLYTSSDSQVLCLAAAPDGTIYAGTGPEGQILCVGAKGKVTVLCEGLDSYVWSLAVDGTGQTIYAGTGPKGKIYQVTPEGKSRVFYTTKQDHILRLALGAHGMLYAGTDKGGLVYRIDPKGKGFVVYHAPQSEVRSLLVTPDALFAGTSAPTRGRLAGGSGTLAKGDSSVILTKGGTRPVSTKKTGKAVADKEVSSPTSVNSSGSGEGDKGAPSSSLPPLGSGENSLYRIAPDGTVKEIFREKALLLCLLRQNGRLLAGTGMSGQLFEIDENTRERSELARLDHGQIHCLCRRQDGSIVLGTGDPGKLYVLQNKYAAKGTLISEVLDAKIISKWGSLTWKADTPTGTTLTLAVRSGNVAEPDDTWSDWSAEQADPQSAKVTAPTARFLQYRVTLTTTSVSATPALRSIAVRYLTTNQAPEITSLDVPDLDAVNLDNPRKVRIKWSATDPNEDELTYHLYVRKEGWKSWVQLEEDFEKKELEWDTTTMPSGMYQFKVVASDRKDNAPEDALTAEKISAFFPVSHTPPTVTLKLTGMEGDKATLEATATDPLVRLTSASFAVNGKKWVNVFPTDGIFDSKTESFKLKTDSLRPGTYVVVLRVRNAAGNTGSADLVFTVKRKTPAD